MTDFEPTDDRSKWPAEAVAVAESCDLPDHAIYYGVVPWPPAHPYADGITLPRQPRGERSWRWCRIAPVTGSRPNLRKWLFAMKWPERENVIESGRTRYRDVLVPQTDPMEKAS